MLLGITGEKARGAFARGCRYILCQTTKNVSYNLNSETSWEFVARLIEIVYERSEIKYPMSGQFLYGICKTQTEVIL